MLATLRSILPYSVRVELARLRRLPAWILEARTVARGRGAPSEHPFVLAEHQSPLRRAHASAADPLQRGKEHNVALAASRIDRIRVAPFVTFSYHHVVGRPSRWRGFRPGLELRDGRPDRGIGGGCCQVSNLLYLLALRGGMKIVERHRHALDLFPDDHRTVPFGCGATVFYNYADLRFENPLEQPVLVRLHVDGESLRGELRTARDPGWRVEIYEVGHRFFRDRDRAGGWMRENRVRRRFVRVDGTTLLDQEVAHNVARVLYEPAVAAPPAPRREIECSAP